MKRTVFSLTLGLALVACGGEDPEPETAERSPVQKQCDSLMATWCESALDCVQSGLPPEDMLSEAELDDELDLCIDVARRTCDSAFSLNAEASYDECSAAVETLEPDVCEAIRAAVRDDTEVSMPSSCGEVFISG